MSSERNVVALLVWVGLLIAPLAWAANTQLGQILPYLDCQHHARFSAIISFAGAIAAGLAAASSWRSGSRAGRIEPAPTLAFAGYVSALAASVFAFALALQGIASLVLSGCER
jgi:hypothetical protein